eukprot:CAMPEP_0184493988 /NCGR_PEP_ID=MMETSP0113_2-20130426/27502_1 /TAXON_ID=91329 /ORGANISM="Norrisiella sphaerica, Strain BC52" /LENGTH=70 /DNA_ID=CAMNT_0026879511 /DNA_START=999 /DNA_END=1207 /DNA_ORIENTATION=-
MPKKDEGMGEDMEGLKELGPPVNPDDTGADAIRIAAGAVFDGFDPCLLLLPDGLDTPDKPGRSELEGFGL